MEKSTSIIIIILLKSDEGFFPVKKHVEIGLNLENVALSYSI